MTDPSLKLLSELNKSASTPMVSTMVDKIFGYKLSEWKAQGDVVKKQIHNEYEDALSKGNGFQYVNEVREKANLITVWNKAFKYITTPENFVFDTNNDFLWGVMQHAKTISDGDIQDLIAYILADELNEPGKYKLNVLHYLKMIGKDELILLEKMGSFIIDDNKIPGNLFFFSKNSKNFMKKHGVDFESLQLLQNIGLFLPNVMSKEMDNQNIDIFKLKYFDIELLFSPNNSSYKKVTLANYFLLTEMGKEILNYLNPEFNGDYYEWLKSNYKISKYSLQEEKK